MTLNERSYTILKKAIAALLVIALCLPIGAMTVSAEPEHSATPSEPTADAFILDDGTSMTMELSEIETADAGNIYVYEVEYDGVLDHTIEVDVENDEAVMTYADGRTETLVISEHVRITKIQQAGAPSFSSVAAELLEPAPIDSPVLTSSGDYINYIYNEELFELDEFGNQEYLGNFVYAAILTKQLCWKSLNIGIGGV